METQGVEGTCCFVSHGEGGARDEVAKPHLVSKRRKHEHLRLSVSGRRPHPVKFTLWLLSAEKGTPGPSCSAGHCSCETGERGSAVFSWTLNSWQSCFFFIYLVHQVAYLTSQRPLKTIIKMQRCKSRGGLGRGGLLPLLDQCLQRFFVCLFFLFFCCLHSQMEIDSSGQRMGLAF